MIHLNEQTGAFEPETLHILGGAMDEAWRRVKLTHLNGSANAARAVLAEHIFAMARQGERDPQRLIEGALNSAHTLSLGQLRVSRSRRFHADVGRDTPYAAPQASFAFGAFCRELGNQSIFPPWSNDGCSPRLTLPSFKAKVLIECQMAFSMSRNLP